MDCIAGLVKSGRSPTFSTPLMSLQTFKNSITSSGNGIHYTGYSIEIGLTDPVIL